MIISYSTQAMRALEALANIDRGAYFIALLRIEGALTATGDGVTDTTVGFTIDDDKYVISFSAVASGIQATIAELDWQVNGV
ncbi:hypothetical protein [Streptomyces mutabilis]|uniref:Uncharacterized protein n=1 Tax=Streptomyces mutabilis TaxID=67332 RepID=A0A086MQZ6_9ACTN|nr:hypothetical protein [Streptomyces mutabilis]KFG71314.1 hypothetical protein FM21_33920 [Streptomyces mutabilis]